MIELTVYVVEKDNAERELLIDVISSGDCLRVVGASADGERAFTEICTLKPDIVVTDLVLPILDGFGLIEKLRAIGNRARIIVVSSLSGDGFITRAMNLGANFYMLKPVCSDRLIDVMTESDFIRTSCEDSEEKSFESKIANIFMSVGIPAHIKGYRYLKEAIKLAVAKPDIMNSITKELYPTVASVYSTTASKVERAIRHAIEVAWNKGRIENINNLFGIKIYTSHDKPTNGELIALIADKLLIDGM
ncbi:MAG: sporulation transcription factor Spo0A [Clostridia bacterium]|nr:sporulation transcription factor Spo0A [Clostridia bacterium]